MTAVLCLNIDYTPLEVISWFDAIKKVLAGKAELVEAYAGKLIRTQYIDFPHPAVVRLVTGYQKRRVRLSRANLLARDAYTCQYCGARPRKSSGAPRLEDLTVDHVVPRAQASNGYVTLPWGREIVRVTSWKNVLTACYECNARKAARTPAQAGMSMRRTPKAPSPIDIAWMSIIKYEIQDEWKTWLPTGSPWADYWDAELED